MALAISYLTAMNRFIGALVVAVVGLTYNLNN